MTETEHAYSKSYMMPFSPLHALRHHAHVHAKGVGRGRWAAHARHEGWRCNRDARIACTGLASTDDETEDRIL